MSSPGASVRIDVWSDYVCPFCYLELPVLERLQAELGPELEVHWRAFELRPAPLPTLEPGGEYLRTTWARAVYPLAEQRGMTLRLPPVQPRSRKAFEAAEFARLQGRFDPMHRALFRAFFEDGRDLADHDVLVEIGRSVGLDGEELRTALQGARHGQKIQADQQLAGEIGVSGVPALVISAGEKGYLVSGAQPYEPLRGVIDRVLEAEALAG